MPFTPTRVEDSVEESLAVVLRTPPIPRLVPVGVFDAFGWCDSDVLEWRRPRDAWRSEVEMTPDNPPGMAFVLRERCDFLPRELARLHMGGIGLTEQWALAPYAIDDATDELYARRARPREQMWLAAVHLPALAWGLHDWAHFHNHGPFVERAWTELQCDATALVWLWINRDGIGLATGEWERARRMFVSASAARFHGESKVFDPRPLDADRLHALAV
jgi:hypothetical protein